MTKGMSVAFVALSTALMAVSYLDRQVFAILAPTITTDLGIDDATYGLLAGTFSVAYLIGPPFAAALLDKVGVRRGLPLAVFVWSCVAAAHAGATGVVALFVLRLALGFAEAPSFPGAARVVKEVVAPANGPRAIGVLFTGSSVGAIIAPPLATAVLAVAGWRFTFVGTALVGLLWIPLWSLLSSREPARTTLDAARIERNADTPGVRAALREPAMQRAIFAIVAAAPIAAFALLWGAKLLVARFGVPQKGVGHYLWMPPLFYDAGAIVFGDLASRARQANPALIRPLFAVAALCTATLGGIAFAHDAMQATLVAGVAMLGVGGAFSILTSELLERVPRSLVSVCAGVSAAAQSLSYIVSSAAVGRVVAGHGGYDAAVVGLTVWAIPGAIAWLAWRNAGPAGERGTA